MTKTYAHYLAAVEDLEAFGFIDKGDKWENPSFSATIEYVSSETDRVRVTFDGHSHYGWRPE